MPRKKPPVKRKADKRGVKASKRLAIACAIVALLTFIVKEVVKVLAPV